ncbi:MAG: sulfurtransferase [Marinobacter sp.]|nr:sulfurtransferase [Marinobacter sp.]
MGRLLIVILLLASSLATAGTDTPPLVDATWLKSHLSQDNIVVLDVRSGIDNGGDRSSFQKAHIPGSVYSSYTDDGWRESRDGVQGVLPPVKSMERLIGGLGIGNDNTVVIVPAGTGGTDFGSAARVYWTFRVLGHDDVTILNGGFAGWQAQGHSVASGEGADRPIASFEGTVNEALTASLDEVEKASENEGQLVDARPEDFFRGETSSPAAQAPGTIPGASNLPYEQFVSEQNGAWYLDAQNINNIVNRAQLNAESPTISFCNTGHWAATDWFVLSELAGFSEVAMYDGSMSEWTQDSDRPVQVAKRGLSRFLDIFN